MKKLLFILSMMICVNMIFAQTATVTIGTVNDPVPGPVVVPVTLDAIFNPNGPSLVSGYALYFYYDASVLVGTPSISFDPFWTGTVVSNTIIDQPAPGLNTIALVYATGGIVEATPPQLIANITFNYVSGSTELLWTTAKSAVIVDDVKTLSYIFDYDGYEYALTSNPGCICTSGYDITFQVVDENSIPLQDALVTIGSESMLTNAAGEAVFNRPDGDYDYTITKAGYYDVSDAVTVAGTSVSVPVSMYPLGSTFDVTFHVTDGTNNLVGAKVIVGVQTKFTDVNGLTVFSRPNGDFNYSVSKYGYTSESGSFTVASADQTIDVILPVLPQVDITFHVTSGGNNVEGASILITDVGTLMTDINGNAIFSMIDGDYNYTITKTGYAIKTGATTVAGSPFTIEETLEQLYPVTIHVTTDGNNLQGATVTVGTQSIVTNASGNAVFNRADGVYSYTVTKAGYNTETGPFTVNGAPVTVEVAMTMIEYVVTFHVTATGNNLEGVLIEIDNGESATTGADGIATFMLADGDYVYTATKDGYGTEQDLVTVSGSPVTQEISMIPDPTYAVTFHVTAVGGGNLEGAQITIGSEIMLTDAQGLAVFNLENGPYDYTVTKLGYVSQTGNFLVINANLNITVVMPLFAWAITFHVVGDGANVSGALVTVNPGNLTGFTGPAGNTILNLVNGTYTYTIEKIGFITQTGTFDVDNANQTIEIELELSPWQVTFHIVSTGGALAGVEVTCNGITEVTNASGNAVFNLINGPYDYEAVKEGYVTQTGTITVNGANQIKNIVMPPDNWPVTFNVTSSGSPVEGATVTVDGTSLMTPANGTVVFQLLIGTYDWTVEHPDYVTQTGTVVVANAAVTVPVVLTVGIDNISANSFNIFPNPSTGTFNLSSSAGNESDISVFDLAGKLIYSGKLEGNDVNVIDLSGQEKGIYMLQILVGDKIYNKKLIVK